MSCVNLNCYIWESGCVVDWTVVAAWLQAILSAAAIFWASKVSVNQVAMQFKNDKLMREYEKIEAQIILTNALFERAQLLKNTVVNFYNLAKLATTKGQFIPKYDKNNYINVFQDAFEDIQKLSIYELKSREIITLYITLRFEIRQIQFNCDIFVRSEKIYTKENFREFEETMLKAIPSFEDLKNKIGLELVSLKKLQSIIAELSLNKV